MGQQIFHHDSLLHACAHDQHPPADEQERCTCRLFIRLSTGKLVNINTTVENFNFIRKTNQVTGQRINLKTPLQTFHGATAKGRLYCSLGRNNFLVHWQHRKYSCSLTPFLTVFEHKIDLKSKVFLII